MKTTYYLLIRQEKPFSIKTVAKGDSVDDCRDQSRGRFLPEGSSFFVGEYSDGVLTKAHNIAVQTRLNKRFRKK